MQAQPGNPYDGHTLSARIEQVERLTGVTAGHNMRLLVAWLTALLRACFMALLPAMHPELAINRTRKPYRTAAKTCAMFAIRRCEAKIALFTDDELISLCD